MLQLLLLLLPPAPLPFKIKIVGCFTVFFYTTMFLVLHSLSGGVCNHWYTCVPLTLRFHPLNGWLMAALHL